MHLRKYSMDGEDFLRSKHRVRWEARPEHNRGKRVGKKYDWSYIEEQRALGTNWDTIAAVVGVEKSKLVVGFCTRKKQRAIDENYKKEWLVYKKRQPDEKRMENVYCPIVNTTGSFALSNCIHSLNCFTRIANLEKKNQNIRDDLLVAMGAQPSYTRQTSNELTQNGSIEPTPIPRKRGRKTAIQVAAEAAAEKPLKE